MIITLEQLRAATGANEANASKYLAPLNDAMGLYTIDDPLVVAGFLSQIGHESGALSTVVENLNYRVEALLSLFSRQRISEDDARAFGRNDAIKQPADQEMIANIIYGGPWGAKNLGNLDYGDGWKYRGRGLKQLTGKYNYKQCGDALGINLVDDPDQLAQPIAAALSAAWFWVSRRPNGIEDAAKARDVGKMTKLINGGDIGLAQRTDLFAKALEAFEVA
jgi:putative chitinase